ncbi:MAG: SpoIIE family protein phosphatase [Ignavibacteriae bacterium]|nr:SpoIIE family protein phosphatase [Ignavibacteriota bacterium]
MQIKNSNSFSNKKLENAVFISVVFFIFKIIFPVNDSLLFLIVNELLVLISVFAWVNYVSEFIDPKLSKPLSLVVNVGILNALIFFIISLTSWLFSESNAGISSGLVYILFSTFIVFVFIGSLAYIFSVYKKLCFHRQKKDPSLYFNTLIIFIILTSLSASFLNVTKSGNGIVVIADGDYDIVYNTFFAISVGLIFLNSLRVAWIAFLNKKQKITLLVISILLISLSAINFATTQEEDFSIIRNFSPALEYFASLVMLFGIIYFSVIFFTTLFHLPTAEAIDRKSEELTSLKDISILMSQVFDFEELSETITSTTIKVSNSDAAWIVIKKNSGFDIHSISGIGLVDANHISTFLMNNNLLIENDVKTTDLQIFDKKHKLPNSIKSVVSAPLLIQNKNNGYLFSARKTSRIFEEEDSKSVSTFAGIASVAIENAKLLEESIEKERLEKELDVARDVQYKILPQQTPKCESLEISALFVPAFEVGGDYYDFFKIDENKLGIVIADVSGKGIEAAFVMAEVKGVFSSLSKLIKNPKEILVQANSILENCLSKKSFVTAIYGIMDTSNGIFNFVRAGHAPLFYFNGNNVEKLIPEGIGLGLDFTNKFSNNLKEMEIQLNNNDILILFTDGINEALNENKEEFGYNRLVEVINSNSQLSVDEISNQIMTSVTTFSKNNSQHDDITLVLLKWNSHKIEGES